MAEVEKRRHNDDYVTTHEREFPGYSGHLCAGARRPMSTNGFTAPHELSGPIEGTTFEHEFGWKESKKNEPIRSGTSSGNRRNNPHPHETFMVWKLPNKDPKGMVTKTAPYLQYRELTDDFLRKILRSQLQTTYQSDYLGIPQGSDMKGKFDAPADWRAHIRRPLDTTFRFSYIRPDEVNDLAGNTTRYGCNKLKDVAAFGAVPTVTPYHVKNQEVIHSKTTYGAEFRSSNSQPNLVKLLSDHPDKKSFGRFLKYVRPDPTKMRKGDGISGDASNQKKTKRAVTWNKTDGPKHQ